MDGFGRQQRRRVGREQAVRHGGLRHGRQGVDPDIVLRALEVQHVHQPDEGRLGGPVIGLPVVAVEARGRRCEDHAAVVAGPHAVPNGLGAIGRAEEVHVHHPPEGRHVHLGEALVGQDAGVVHQDVDPAPEVLGTRHHGGDLVGPRHVRAVRHGAAARGLDLGDDARRALGRRPVAAEVVDDHAGAPGGQPQRMGATEPSAGPRDHCDPAVEPDAHALSRFSRPCPAAPRTAPDVTVPGPVQFARTPGRGRGPPPGPRHRGPAGRRRPRWRLNGAEGWCFRTGSPRWRRDVARGRGPPPRLPAPARPYARGRRTGAAPGCRPITGAHLRRSCGRPFHGPTGGGLAGCNATPFRNPARRPASLLAPVLTTRRCAIDEFRRSGHATRVH